MKPINCFYLAALGCLICVLSLSAALQAQDPAPKKSDPSHKSLAAYPNAVISLKDPKSGMLFYVESNGRRLVAFAKDGSVAWSVDVIDETKVPPLHGTAVIRDLHLDDGVLGVTYGKSDFAKVNIDSGKTQYLSRD